MQVSVLDRKAEVSTFRWLQEVGKSIEPDYLPESRYHGRQRSLLFLRFKQHHYYDSPITDHITKRDA